MVESGDGYGLGVLHKQPLDVSLLSYIKQVEGRKIEDFEFNDNGRYCVPNDKDLSQSILREAHASPYAIHLGGNKMYQDVKDSYWWPGLKRDMTEFAWKWERTTIDIVSGLPLITTKKYSIWVTWGTHINHLKSRFSFYISILEKASQATTDSFGFQ
ncbi:protein NYNRIN-like [Gossypium australe]|uniref:Protein NYNRIN-like n=1 Tax=Gossypium australe TaxID=47621 RepID=A0A5B6X144_9ROSI|nr:protein NYNRIN-like [Gossypium australe]